MKRRLFCFVLLLSMLFCACQTEQTSKIEQPFTLYFLNEAVSADSGALRAVTVSMNVKEMTAEQIVREYMNMLPPEGAKCAVPLSWQLETVYIEEKSANVIFYGATTTASQKYLAAACLTKILTQLEFIETVCLRAPGENEMLCLSNDDILLEDTAMLPQEETIVLYMPDDERRYLVKQVQTVEAMEVAEKPRYILQRLLQTSSVNSCIPQGTQLLEISVDNGLCKIDLSSEFVTGMEKCFSDERLAIYSIVNSLTELPEITTVDIWIEGAPLDRLSFMKLPVGMEYNATLLFSYGENVKDVDLYLPCDGEKLVAIPYQLALNEDVELHKLLINALIEFDGDHGARNYIPNGTKLLNVRMEESACIVDLSGEFLTACKSAQEEQLAIYSIVATLCGVDGISSVEILVEGLEPTYRNEWLSNVRQPDLNWYAEG